MKMELEALDIEMLTEAIAEKINGQLKKLNREMINDSSDLISVRELCKYLSVKRDWIYQQVYNRSIPYFKIGGLLRFRKSEIEKWLTKSRT